MSLKEEISNLLNEIRDNQERDNGLLDVNINKIKELITSQKLNSKQYDLYLEWCNVHCPEFISQYLSSQGGYYYENQFQTPILDLVFELENQK